MYPKSHSAFGRRNGCGDQGVSWRTAQPLTQTIDEAQTQDQRPDQARRQERSTDIGECVSAADQTPGRHTTIQQCATEQSQHTSGRFCTALNDAHYQRTTPQGAGDERRQQWRHHLAG